MKIVVAIDSLKGSLTSIQAGEAIEKGIKKVDLEAEVVIKPLADGGEGTVDALVDGMGGNMEFIKVTGPAGKSVLAKYGIIRPTKSDMEETSTAIMEMSQAAGITQVTDKERNPLYTTTYGVGQMIVDAIHKGCRRFIMGIGGSATNDGGVGMLQALGYDFLDKDGNQIKHGAIGLKDLVQIKDADIVITGEGCLDAQTAMGKAPIGVAKLAKKYGKLVLGFSGAVTKGATACNEAGIDAYFPIVRSAVSLEDAMKKKNAQENLIDTVEQVFRLIKVLK
ncbi:glycerate kinase family protein [Anaerostipes hadrus]|uniref:glycerate kinase family protein n=1 Tax=Anaerostipes hadrus TaxID=649756 RepID=UPI001EE0E410|nr:glycerate kinase [Anaerostipes hadrus]MCG4625962.1 glycerate kinase [Anaerostipes hadrus]